MTLQLVGCASTHQESPETLIQEVTTQPGQPTEVIRYQGKILKKENSDNDSASSMEYSLDALKPKNGKDRVFMVVSYQYEGQWKQYLHAIDRDGRRYEALSISSTPSCELFCNLEERLVFEIPVATLNSNINQGLEFHLEGPSNHISPGISFPPTYLSEFIETIHLTH